MAGTSLPDPEFARLRKAAFTGGAVGGAVGTIVIVLVIWLICGCPCSVKDTGPGQTSQVQQSR